VHGSAGEVPVDGLVVIEPGDQPVKLGAGLGLCDTTFQLADARRDYRAINTLRGFCEIGLNSKS